MQEIWKPLVNWEGIYEVSNMGNVRSVDRYVIQRNYKRFCTEDFFNSLFIFDVFFDFGFIFSYFFFILIYFSF